MKLGFNNDALAIAGGLWLVFIPILLAWLLG